MDVVGEFAAVAVGHPGHQPVAVAGRVQVNFGNPRKVAAGGVCVTADRRAKVMTIDPLEKIEIGLGFLAGERISGIKDGFAIRAPSGAASTGRVLDAGDVLGQPLAGVRPIKIQRALLAAVLGK